VWSVGLGFWLVLGLVLGIWLESGLYARLSLAHAERLAQNAN